MSFSYKFFGIPRKIDEFFDLASRGKSLDIYVKEYFILIPPQHGVSYGLRSGNYSLEIESYEQMFNPGESLGNKLGPSIFSVALRNFTRAAIMTCEGLISKGLTATVNGDSPERARQKLNLLESKIMALED